MLCFDAASASCVHCVWHLQLSEQASNDNGLHYFESSLLEGITHLALGFWFENRWLLGATLTTHEENVCLISFLLIAYVLSG